VVVFAFGSVMENLPPVILTDEDICLEVTEKGKYRSSLLWLKTDAGFRQFTVFTCKSVISCRTGNYLWLLFTWVK